YRRRAREVYRESRLILARLNAQLQENIAGVGTVQAFGQEAKMHSRFQQINYGYRNVLLRSVRYNAVFFPIIEIFSALTIGLLLWYGGGLILQQTIQAGVIVAFIQYIQRMYQPIRDLAEKYNIMQAAMASSERIFALLDTPATIKNPLRPKAPEQFLGEVEFKDVWLFYNPGEPVLKGISFRVRPGEKIALVGATGGGRHRSSPRCADSMMSRAARSWWTVSTSGIGISNTCAASLAWCCRTFFFFPVISPRTSRSATRA